MSTMLLASATTTGSYIERIAENSTYRRALGQTSASTTNERPQTTTPEAAAVTERDFARFAAGTSDGSSLSVSWLSASRHIA